MMDATINTRRRNGTGRGAAYAPGLPPIDFTHFRTLTDDTGILQHATYSVPNREHGYCIDDNARALIVACEADRIGLGADVRDLVPTYLSFIAHAFNRANGRFRNFMSYGREWLEEAGSEDAHGRTMWGLGVAAAAAPLRPQRMLATSLLLDGLPVVHGFNSPRALAFTIIGLDRYLDHHRDNAAVCEAVERLAKRLHRAFADNGRDGWWWCENTLTYANAMLPLALLATGERLHDSAMVETALRALNWLITVQGAPEGHLSIIGNDGWLACDTAGAQFDQQPLEAAALVMASVKALKLTGDACWHHHATVALGWFLGRNDLGMPLYDPHTGGCCDGLQAHGANANQGAESTVEWLLARLAMHDLGVRDGAARDIAAVGLVTVGHGGA